MTKRIALRRLQHLREALLRVLEEIGGFSAYVFHPYPGYPAHLQVHVTADRFRVLVEELGLEPYVQTLAGNDDLDRAAVTIGGVEIFTLLPTREEVKEAC